MSSISVQEMLFCSLSVPLFIIHKLMMCISEFTNPSLHDMLLLSNTAWPHATPIVSFTCVGIDYAGSPEDWRQIEDIFDRIRNCGESVGHTDSYIACTLSMGWPTRSGVK